MTIPPRFLDELRSRLTLSDVIGKKVRLVRAGREFKGCCPFHKEKSPSFTVNDDKQFYHCFGCGAHGDVLNFVMQHDNLSFIDAVAGLAAQAGLQMPEYSQADAQKAEKSRDLYALTDAAARWMQAQLKVPANRDVLAYLQGRGVSEPSIETFRIGFAPDDRQALKKELLAKGFKESDMLEAGLLKTPEKGGESYVFFRGRVMFPVMDRRGRVVAFGGRILPDHMRPQTHDGFKPAKYMNSGETPLFDKGRMLYAEPTARQAARDDLPILVTEGYMDVVACHQAGFRGAVAPMGTALTEQQMILLWSMIPKDTKIPVLCFDGDAAGQRAAERAAERVLPLLKPGQSVRFAFLPPEHDPDSLIKASGAPAFKAILDQAVSLFDFLWQIRSAHRDLTTPEIRAGIQKALQDDIRKIADREVQGFYQQMLKEKIGSAFFTQRKPGFDSKMGGKFQPPVPSVRLNKPGFHDLPVRILLAALINHPHIFGAVEEGLAALTIGNADLDRLRQALLEGLADDQSLDTARLCSYLSQAGYAKEMRDIVHESVYVHASFAAPHYKGDDIAKRWHEVGEHAQTPLTKAEERASWGQVVLAGDAEQEQRLIRRAAIMKEER